MAGKSIKGSKSHDNLKEAFAGESQANRRYLYFARVADIEGFPDMAGLFKDTADAETGHAFGHMDFLKEVGDPATLHELELYGLRHIIEPLRDRVRPRRELGDAGLQRGRGDAVTRVEEDRTR